MSATSYERLSAQDASFLFAEDANQPMHVGGLALFDAEPLQLAGGGIDIERYRSAVESVLHWIPRYRQKIAWTPVEGWPVWVDDRRFDLRYHIRHIALPRPGSREQLSELAARIHSRRLSRAHALWEIWVIEGVEDGTQFAVLNKIHHCMIDGAAGADLSQILMSPSDKAEATEPMPYMPRPAPSTAELLRDTAMLHAKRPFEVARDLLSSVAAPAEDDEGLIPNLSRRVSALREMGRYVLEPATRTPINGDLGPNRRIDWLTMPLEDVRELRRVLDCTINDIVLATVTGALRRYLFRRRIDFRGVDFRVAAPVSTRRPEHDRRQGNHVSTWVVPLPLRSEDPLERVAKIHETTETLKKSEAALAVDTIMQVGEFLPGAVMGWAAQIAGAPANMIVTNVPGPQFPLYTVGARMLGLYPLVPLLPGGGLGIALFSYEGKLCVGFNADHELVPDLGHFVGDLTVAFEELRASTVAHYVEQRTGAAPEEPKEREVRRPRRPARAKSRARTSSSRRSNGNGAGAGNGPAAGNGTGTGNGSPKPKPAPETVEGPAAL